MRIYCPNCWRDYPDDTPRCSVCGAALALTPSEEDFVAKLIRALRHPEPLTVERAATLLGQIGDRRAVEPLLAMLAGGAAPEALAAAAASLAALGETRALSLLARRLADPASFLVVRLAAVRALAQLGGPAAEAALHRALGDRSPTVRALARDLLPQLGGTTPNRQEAVR
jgi:HEAT repeat protein